MATRDEFTNLLNGNGHGGSNTGNGDGSTTPDWMKSWAKQQQQQQPPSPARSGPRPPYAPKPGGGEQSPLLPPPLPQSALAPPPPKQRKGHGRSHSEFMWTEAPPESSHPLKGGMSPSFKSGGNRPPRKSAHPAPPHLTTSVPLTGSATGGAGVPAPRGPPKNVHRRIKSDIPLRIFDNGSVGGGQRVITKADLIKNMPNPRWGGVAPSKSMHTRNRSRTGSDGPIMDDNASVKSGFSGYGAIQRERSSGSLRQMNNPLLQSIGSVDLGPTAKKNIRHVRGMSDASALSVTTDMAKSALFKGVTDTGRIQLQLPKDSFRILMDSTLETGQVYKRKMVDDENEFFVEFHCVEDQPHPDSAANCSCECDRCNRCHEKHKSLPPDLYVMAVGSDIYRRMLDEVIDSRTMPCGTFFCGHHEDVRHPDITIAALAVGVVFILLLGGTLMLE